MLLNGPENGKLFAKEVPITVKDVYTNQSRSTRLFLTMEWQEGLAGMYNRKVLSLILTDNDDPFFYYNLNLSEEDFQMLKANQGILIAFPAFPEHIIQYIDKCLLEEKNPQPKFLLIFTLSDKLPNASGPPQLDIIETSQFKHLTHLSLKFSVATESTMKTFIISSFRSLKENNRQLRNKLAFTEQTAEEKLTAFQKSLATKEEEFEFTRNKLREQLTQKESQHDEELQQQRDRLISMHEDEKNRLEKEIKVKECNFHKEIQKLESKTNSLETLIKEKQDENYKKDSIIRELNLKVSSFEAEINQLKENLQSYKHKIERLQSDVKERQSKIRQCESTIHELQQQLRIAEQSISKLEKQIESQIESNKSLVSELDNVKCDLDICEKSREQLENEKKTLEGVIKELQEKSGEIVKEEKAKNQLIAKYKKTIEQKDKDLQTANEKIASLDIYLRRNTADMQILTDSKSALQEKIENLLHQLEEKEAIVKWLNKQMTDNCIVPQYVPPFHFKTSPSAIAQKQLAKIVSHSPEPVAEKNTAAKSVRIEAASPVCKTSNFTTSHFHKTVDSAYYTASLHSNQATPTILDFDIDQEAINGAFGNGNHIVKHSTAKKSTKLVKSSTPKTSKKR